MAVDIFEPRSMAEALASMKPVPTFFKTMFFGTTREYTAEHVDVDIMIGGREVAPYVGEQVPPTVVDKKGFKTYSFTPPHIRLSMATRAEHLRSRNIGEHIYQDASPESRAAKQAGEDLARLDAMIGRREEIMCVQALEDGVLTMTGDGYSATADFAAMGTNWAADHKVTPGVTWDNATVANRRIRQNLWDWAQIVNEDSGLLVDNVIMGVDAFGAFMADVEDADGLLHGLLDNRRIEMGLIDSDTLRMGAQYIGTLKGLTEMDLWVYPEKDEGGNRILDPDKIIMASSQARAEMRYGAVPIARGVDNDSAITLVAGARVPDSEVMKNPAQRVLYLSSRPIPVPIEINGFLVADVMA